YFMIDISSSMLTPVSTGLTRWDAVSQAIVAFFNDPQSAGISVGLQYFPQPRAGAPTSCTSDAACGPGAPCYLELCLPPAAARWQEIPCSTKYPGLTCPSGWLCKAYGLCSNQANTVCFFPGLSSGRCGTCSPPNPSTCVNYASCTASDYATP